MARTISIRQNLLRDLLLVILLLSGGILTTTIFAARQTTEVLSRAYMGKAIDATNARLEGFFAPVRRELRMLGAWGEAGLLDGDDPAALNRLLVPLLRLHPQITSLMVADGRGREYLLLRSGERWSNRLTRRDEWGSRTRWLEWSERAPEPVETWRDLDYDPRARPWYRGALKEQRSGANALHWTEPYTFFTTKDPGVTASLAFGGQAGLDLVVGADVLLSDLSRFTTALDITENGKVLVVTEDGRLIGLPRDARFERAEERRAALLQHPDSVGIPLLADAVAAFSSSDAGTGIPLRFESAGKPWWALGQRFALSPARALLVGVVIPESDLLGRLNQLRLTIAGVTLAVLLVALLRAIVVSRRIGGPIEALVSQSDRMARGDLGPGEPVESPLREVSRLAEAQERMRLALRTLMKMERDLQLAREIQQRALPERLPALPGFAIAAWGEPAEAAGGDSYDVVGYRSSAGGPGEEQRTLALDGADHALLLMADATGHGIGPALSVTQVRAMLRMAARSGNELARIVRYLNEQLAEDLPPGRFVTAWLADLDARRHTLTSFSAGQAPLLHYDASRGAVEERPADAPPLGLLEAVDIAIPAPLSLRRGDLFAVISDGVFEASDPEGREFGVQRVCELIVRHSAAGPDQTLVALRTALADFARGAPARDDRTALLIQRTR